MLSALATISNIIEICIVIYDQRISHSRQDSTETEGRDMLKFEWVGLPSVHMSMMLETFQKIRRQMTWRGTWQLNHMTSTSLHTKAWHYHILIQTRQTNKDGSSNHFGQLELGKRYSFTNSNSKRSRIKLSHIAKMNSNSWS